MKHLALALGLITFSAPTIAAPITLTGAEFASLSGITFPTGTQTIVGDSLRIDVMDTLSVVASLALDQFNVDVSDFEVQIDITRLIRDDGVVDFDPLIYLSDGLNLFGGQFLDFVDDAIGVATRQDELSSDGQSLIRIRSFNLSPTIPVAVNNSFLAIIGVQATSIQTNITGSINNEVANSAGTTSTLFNFSNGGPSLVIVSSDFNENYLINSVTFSRGVSVAAIPEPGTLGPMTLGLVILGLASYRRRFRFG